MKQRSTRRSSRKLWIQTAVTLPAVVLIAAVANGAGAQSPVAVEAPEVAEGTNRVAIPDFDPKTWKPTAETPLPPLESPITFHLSDESSYWFDTGLTELEPILHTRSAAAGVGPTTIKFSIGEPFTGENHTVSSIIWPEGAKNMPFVQQGSQQGELSVDLSTPGLYAFQCRVHPYMLGAVAIDDPTTAGVDVGQNVRWIDGTIMPSFSDEILKIVRSFFIVTEPANWQRYADQDTTWDPSYPAAPFLFGNADGTPHLIPDLDAFYQEMFREPMTLPAPVKPTEPGIGEAYVGTQWEHSAGKTKPSSITAFDTETWEMSKKFFLPSVNMNNAHNFWSDKDGKYLYANNWFSNKVTTIDRETGTVLHDVEVGPSPSHVMTRPNNDNLVIPNNGGGRIVELSPGGEKVIKSYLTQKPGENPAFPHAHWISYDGKYVVTPNSNESQVTIFDLDIPSMVKPESGGFPVASSMTNDGKRAYTSNLLDHTVTCHSVKEPACPTPSGEVVPIYKIDLRANYDKVSGAATGPFALSPIQTPVSPDDSYMLGVGTFTSNITVFDMKTNKLVKTLPCGPGCHGINFGLKKGGGWYGYVSIKFANKLIVVDGDPNGDGNPEDATIAGEVLTDVVPAGAKVDDTPTSNLGQGGNGVYAYPNPYNGWVQKMPEPWQSMMTCKQREPISAALC
jgi:YVTN family beta-propeller protein